MSNVASIGRYQLENLHRNGVRFTFLDLRAQAGALSADLQTLLQGSVRVGEEDVLAYVRSQNLSPNAPIVLICENGAKSIAIAQRLEEDSFINVFVVEGGIAALEVL